jgi:hypothetical protein
MRAARAAKRRVALIDPFQTNGISPPSSPDIIVERHGRIAMPCGMSQAVNTQTWRTDMDAKAKARLAEAEWLLTKAHAIGGDTWKKAQRAVAKFVRDTRKNGAKR